MRHLIYRSFVLSAVVGSAVLAVACGDDLVVPDEGAPRSITIVQGGSQSGTAGQPLPVSLVVEVKDDVGRPVAQQPLTIALDDGGTIVPAQPVTSNDGRATFTWTLGPAAGAQELSVATAANGPSVTFHGNAASATANVAQAVSGNGQTGQAGTALADSLTLQVTDEFGNPVAGAAVTWTTSDGSVSPSTGTTNAGGLARTRWTLGGNAGSQSLTASVAGVTDPVGFSATATPGPTPVLVMNRQPSGDAESGKAIQRQPRIQLQDGEGHELSTAGVTVTATLNGGVGSLSGATATTGGDGRADFAGLTITAPAGTYTLTFSASGYTSVTSENIALSNRPVSPAKSTLTVDSATMVAGGTTIIRARIVDADDKPLPGVTVMFGVTGSGHTLQQPGLPTDADGQVTGTLSATVSGPRTIIATAGNVQLSDNAVVQVVPGPPAPATTEATVSDGSVLSVTTILIQAADAFGNLHTTGGFTDRFVVSVTGTVTSTRPITDNGDGTYSASFLKLLPGADTVAITLDGVPIKGSPYVSN